MAAKLTIGMAHHEDYDGAYFTLQALRMYHGPVLAECELVVIDNSPDTRAGQMVESLLKTIAPGTAGTKYVKMPAPLGTSPSRERIFAEASAPAVLVMDCHVLLWAGALQRLIAWYDGPASDSRDIHSGPLVLDSLTYFHTHFDDEWRGEMWGTWANAWRCQCGAGGVQFSTEQLPENRLGYRLLAMGRTPLSKCGQCGARLPELPYAQHEQQLLASGYVRLGSSDDHPPFEIPGMGLGLFTCRREAWPGFHPHARGFGGEELYIHEKFRQRGGQALCLPWLRWVHRFGRANGISYPLTNWNKVRNYVLELQELGRDLAPVHEHFVEGGKINQQAWEHLLEDPIAHEAEPPQACGTCGDRSAGDPLSDASTLEEVFTILQGIPRDLDQHLDKLAELASQCEHITEFSKRRESTVGLAYGRPLHLISYQVEQSKLLDRLPELAAFTKIDRKPLDSPQVQSISETDLLFLDSTEHTYARLSSELAKYAPAVKRYIVVHDTKLHGFNGEDGGRGYLEALRDFMRENPQWSVISHTNEQYGLTVLGCRASDKPQLPSTITMAKNLAVAATQHIASGAQASSPELLEQRLLACTMCPQRKDDRCTVCGCFIAAKAAMQSQECPLGEWPMAGDLDGQQPEQGAA